MKSPVFFNFIHHGKIQGPRKPGTFLSLHLKKIRGGGAFFHKSIVGNVIVYRFETQFIAKSRI